MPGNRDRRTRHRSAPRKNLRSSFVVPFVVPAVLATGVWGYAAAGLTADHVRSAAESDRASTVAAPAQALISRLQDERRFTAVWQAARDDATRQALDEARERTDAAVASYRTASASALDTGRLSEAGDRLGKTLDGLGSRRDAIDDGSLSRTETFRYFTGAVTHGTDLAAAALRSDHGPLAEAGAATTAVIRLTEMLAREDALLSAALTSRRLDAATRSRFTQYLAVQQELRSALTTRDLPAGGAAAYGEITESRQWTAVNVVEEAVSGSTGTGLPRQTSTWPDAAESVVGDLQELGAGSVTGFGDAASDRAADLLLTVLLGSAVSLTVLTAGAFLLRRGRRAALDRVTELQQRTQELSDVWLPQVLARIERGEPLDPRRPAPGPAADALERLGGAVEHLAHTAAEAALRQNLGREGTEKVFAQLIRRTQILIHRLISLLDDLERKHEDSDLLKDIFKVDHLATRVRRHAENLVILSGAPPSRRLTAPVSITDVMRSAVAETEQYTRVKVKNLPADLRLALTGRAVADVTHLLAELIENGTSFSPPETQVFISATKVAKGLAVHVEDHGLGMPEDMREQANQLLAHPPKLDMTALGEDPRLGHFVVARLAERHRIKVELRESVYGGTLVVVVLPAGLLEEIESPVLDQLKSAAAAAGQAVQAGPGERAGLASGPAETGAPPLVAETALAGVGAGAGTVRAGSPATRSPAGDVPTHDRMPDHSGFPDYGGAGLLPPVHPKAGSGTPVPPPRPEQPRHPADPGTRAARAQDQRVGPAERPEDVPRPAGSTGGGPVTGAAFPGPGRDAVSAPGPAQDTGPLTTPTVLPQRTRGASLAQQLRKEADEARGEQSDADNGGLSPDASARAMIAIQQGLKRARFHEGGGQAGPDDREVPRDPGIH